MAQRVRARKIDALTNPTLGHRQHTDRFDIQDITTIYAHSGPLALRLSR